MNTETKRILKFRIIHKGEISGYERLTSKDGSIHWEWMCLDLNPDNGSERWNRGVYPHGYEYIRQQFTGLLDKNGKEIFEGDIVCSSYTLEGKPLSWTVVWHHGSWRLKNEEINSIGGGLIAQSFWKRCEVIGHIFESSTIMVKQ